MRLKVRIKSQELAAICDELGIRHDAELAERMHVSPSTVHRARRGITTPGAAFIAALLQVIRPYGFDDVFEVAEFDHQLSA